jgi:hypothetical protein
LLEDIWISEITNVIGHDTVKCSIGAEWFFQ